MVTFGFIQLVSQDGEYNNNNADVFVEVMNFSDSTSDYSDSTGKFILKDLPTGEYTISEVLPPA